MLLQVKNLKAYFPIKGGILSNTSGQVKAVDDISLNIERGETVGLVGESGSGKSTLGRAILQLVSLSGGLVRFNDVPYNSSRKDAKKVQMIFQDPLSSLNPRMTVGAAIAEVLKHHKLVPRNKVMHRVKELFRMVELSPEYIHRYPHELSGGQCQRVGIARALSVEPELIICDEIVSALDVSVQAQIINLLKKLQKDKKLSYLFISHDLAVVRQIANRIAVMYCGKIVEYGDVNSIILTPFHPYTKALITIAGEKGHLKDIMKPGDIANPANLPEGCHFHPRCPVKDREDKLPDICKKLYPDLIEKIEGHFVACFQQRK